MTHTTRCNPATRVLVTGATGYIGGRLVPRLLAAGYAVRCLARSPRKLEDRPWSSHEAVDIVEGDVEDGDSLRRALAGCSAAYYLVHSMLSAGADYAQRDSRLAGLFATACHDSGCKHIIYLGGLGETGAGLSEHLSSRQEVEDGLRSRGATVTVLRAAMIIGAGSASFEILRYLVERLPLMITPRWVSTECQPIAVGNCLHYLVTVLSAPETHGRTLDIGGDEVMSYREILQTMARCLGLRRRWIIPVPVLTPRLSSLWIHLVTPLSRHIARPLAEGLRNRVVCGNDDAANLMPQDLLSIERAIREGVGTAKEGSVETSWTDSGALPGDPDWAGGKTFVDRRTIEVSADAETTFRSVCRIGGGNGWYAADFLWRLRGAVDRMVGGPGLRRGRRQPQEIGYGDVIDFWRVTGIEPERRLELRAEMKLPGEAQLQFEIERTSPTTATLVQTARFRPRGLQGLAYWFLVAPLHTIVFGGMLRGIGRAAEADAARSQR